MLLAKKPRSIAITFSADGSYAATYKAQGSDYGFVGGILGIEVSDENLRGSVAAAMEQGIAVSFAVKKMRPEVHPNYAKIEVTTADAVCTVESLSTGGGAFEIISVNGFSVSIKGDSVDVLVFCAKEMREEIEKRVRTLENGCVIESSSCGADCLLDIRIDHAAPEGLLKTLRSCKGIRDVKLVDAVLPVVKKNGVKPLFLGAAEALEHGGGRRLWELACEYEEAISGKSEKDIIVMMDGIAQVMKESALKGIAGEGEARGYTGPQAGAIEKNMRRADAKAIDMGLLNEVMVWALAAIEYDIRCGRIVAAPTGGSCGVLPATVVLIGERLGKSGEDIARALLAAGLIGIFIEHFATFAAELCGCQAENGAAGAMAAGGLVELLGGSADEAFKAASLSLQNILGLICDPVASVGNVPCVSRNALAAVNAVMSANMVLNGFDPVIPLDETIQAMMDVGRLMSSDLRCTGRGGLCATPTAKRLVSGFNPLLEES
jgi:L-serine dehydratase